MAETSYEWSTSRKLTKKKSMMAQTDAYDDLMAKFSKLQTENEKLKRGKFSVNALEEESNDQLVEEVNYLQGNYRQDQGFGKSQAYYPNNRHHPNLSYVNPNNFLKPPPGFAMQNGAIVEPPKTSLEDIVASLATNVNTFVTKTESKFHALEGTMITMQKQMKMVENQVGQISNSLAGVHKLGVFPSNTEQNPKGQQNCSAINLRSGTEYTNHGPDPKKTEKKLKEDANMETEEVEQPIGQPVDRQAARQGDPKPAEMQEDIGQPVDRQGDR